MNQKRWKGDEKMDEERRKVWNEAVCYASVAPTSAAMNFVKACIFCTSNPPVRGRGNFQP